MIQGLTITGSCQPVAAGDNTYTMQCATTITNNGPYTVMVAAGLLNTDGSTGSLIISQLLPGQAPLQLPTPASGTTWVIAVETTAHANMVGDFWFAASLGIGVLAGIGAVCTIRAITRH
jgi:hypothetical protein